MNLLRALVCLLVASSAAQAADWPSNPRLSGNSFLPPGLIALANDTQNNPLALWQDKGVALWDDTSTGPSCQSCHGSLQSMGATAARFPKLVPATDTVINLEDQIVACRKRSGKTGSKLEDDEVLALSAALHSAARGKPIAVEPPAGYSAQWQGHVAQGAQLFTTRMGRINLACMHCHDQNVGRQMRTDVISPANPTGFPVYRMTWQRLGSIDRRLRACYSGVQAVMPPSGDPALRDLELYLKVRATGLPLDGPAIRR